MSESKPKPIARRAWLTEPRLQLPVAGAFFMVQLVAVLCYQGLLQLQLGRRAEAADERTQELLAQIGTESIQTLFVAAGLSGVLMILLGLWVSHRYFGPLPRLRWALHEMALGHKGVRVALRPGDSLGSLAHEVNQLAERLEHEAGESKPSGSYEPEGVAV